MTPQEMQHLVNMPLSGLKAAMAELILRSKDSKDLFASCVTLRAVSAARMITEEERILEPKDIDDSVLM